MRRHTEFPRHNGNHVGDGSIANSRVHRLRNRARGVTAQRVIRIDTVIEILAFYLERDLGCQLKIALAAASAVDDAAATAYQDQNVAEVGIVRRAAVSDVQVARDFACSLRESTRN
jgi:hypothetical protein